MRLAIASSHQGDPVRPEWPPYDVVVLGLIRLRGQFDYAACRSVNCLSNSAGLTIPMAE